MKLFTIFFTLCVLSIIPICEISKNVEISQEVTGKLKQAADASSVEMALGKISEVIAYLKNRGDTSGFTSILYQTPNEDVSFWYNNLKRSLDELSKIDNLSSQTLKTNVLMKLRETLMDNNHVTIPDGFSRYPNNGLWAFLNLIFVAGLLLVIFYMIPYLD